METTIPSKLDRVHPAIHTTRRILTADVTTVFGERIEAGTEFHVQSVPQAMRVDGRAVRVQWICVGFMRTRSVLVEVAS